MEQAKHSGERVKISGGRVKISGGRMKLFEGRVKLFGVQVIERQGRGEGSFEQLLGSAGIVEDAEAGILRRRRQGCLCLAAPNLPKECLG